MIRILSGGASSTNPEAAAVDVEGFGKELEKISSEVNQLKEGAEFLEQIC